MWRRLVPLFVVWIAGCSTPSDAQVLADLEARATSCGAIDNSCVAGANAGSVAECMNMALELDQVASTAWSDYDPKGYLFTDHVFVDGSEVRFFTEQPDDSGGPSTVTESFSCPGPLSVSTNTVCGSIPVLTIPGCF